MDRCKTLTVPEAGKWLFGIEDATPATKQQGAAKSPQSKSVDCSGYR